MNWQSLILLLLLWNACGGAPALSDEEPTHRDGKPDSERVASSGADENKPENSRQKPDRKAILERLASRDKEGPLADVWGEERTDLIQSYVQGLEEMSTEEREKAVLEFLGKITLFNDLKDFFDASESLPETVRLQNEESLLKLDPQVYMRVLNRLSKDNQTKGIERAIPAAKKDPWLMGRLAVAASKVGFQFSKSDLEAFVFQQKGSDPELLKQALQKIPRASERLLELIQKSDDPNQRLNLMRGISNAISNGHLKLGPKEQEGIGNIATDSKLSSEERKEAYRVLEKKPTRRGQGSY